MLYRQRRVLLIATKSMRRPTATTFVRRGRQRLHAGRPDGGCTLNAHHIAQAKLRQGGTKLSVVSIGGIGQHDALRNTLSDGLSNLLQRDFQLGPERDLFRNLCFGSPFLGVGPGFWKIQTPSHWQAGTFVCNRKTDGHLTVILLAGLPTILSRYTHRMRSLLGNSGVIHDPGRDGTASFHDWQDIVAHVIEKILIAPRGCSHHVVQRLVHTTNVIWSQTSRDRFNALTFTGQQ